MEPTTLLGSFKLLADLALSLKGNKNAEALIAILRERLELADDQTGATERERDSLKEKLADALKEIDELKERLAIAEISKEFVIRNGVAWLKDADGKLAREPYCPTCRTIMSIIHFVGMKDDAVCQKCKYRTPSW